MTQLEATLPEIEPGIAPLCAAFNRVRGVATLWSCEGHPTRWWMRPYVTFVSDQRFAFAVDKAIRPDLGGGAGLRFVWSVSANFHDNGALKYTIQPEDRRFGSANFLGLARWTRRQVRADLAVLEGLIAQIRELGGPAHGEGADHCHDQRG
jgi:hypothetical protein